VPDLQRTNTGYTALEHEIIEQIRALRFGSLEIQVHNARIVQVERREKRRYDQR
jgi:hypothetical protein